jgi:YidC/Oxa1 family membrane protein insertase
MFNTYIIQPVFNFLELIYALIPGHDLGIAIIIFTVLVRLALWPLVKKQLHHAQAMRRLQPELKKLKKAASGDRQKEARLQMELYKERGIKPFSSIGTLIIQIPVFIALYQAILKITNNPKSLVDFSYSWIHDLSWIHTLSTDINRFDESFLGLVDLSKRGLEAGGAGIYFPAVVVAVASTFMQYNQTKLTMMNNKDSRKLSVILKEAASGKETDQAEVTAAVGKLMLYFLPVVTFLFALIVPSALSLYLLTSSTVGFFQTRRVLHQDSDEMHEIASEGDTKSDSSITTKTTVTTVKKKASKSKPKTGAKKKRKR